MLSISKQSLFSFSLLIAVSITTGWFLVKKINETEENFPFYIFTPTIRTFDSYNKTLSRHTVTGVKDLEGQYKKVTVSNNTITFSFEVPDTWLTETRNSGEVEMNEEELREFLGTNYDGDIRSESDYDRINKIYFSKDSQYTGINWNTLKDMPYKEMLRCLYGKSDCSRSAYPNATVSPLNHIYYSDANIQIDFFLINKVTATSVKSLLNIQDFSAIYQKEIDVLREKIEKNEIDLMKSGQVFSIDVGHNTILRIRKQTYAENFEEGFKHIIDTLSFE